jgi:hypothetical protein
MLAITLVTHQPEREPIEVTKNQARCNQGISMSSTTASNEDKPREGNFFKNAETIGKWISIIVSVAAFVFGVITFATNYNLQSKNYGLQVKNYTRELKKPFYQHQLETYKKAIETVQVLATIENRKSDAWKTKANEFWQLYWGAMGLVETREVEQAMIAIGKCLDAPCDRNLKSLSLDLSHALRDSIQASWEVDLPALAGK